MMHRTSTLSAMLPLAGGLGLALCQWLILVYAPVDGSLGFSQKIFYTHLPLAWWGLISFFIVFCASILYLWRRTPLWDTLALAAAEVGVSLAALALLTGCIWAKKAWGVWWLWDSRLTTTLVLCFLYAGYLVLQGLDLPAERRAVIRAVVGIVAFLDVPLVFFATRIKKSVHPVGTMSGRDGLEPEMRLTILACLAAFGLLWAAFLLLRYRLGALEERVRILAEKTEDSE